MSHNSPKMIFTALHVRGRPSQAGGFGSQHRPAAQRLRTITERGSADSRGIGRDILSNLGVEAEIERLHDLRNQALA